MSLFRGVQGCVENHKCSDLSRGLKIEQVLGPEFAKAVSFGSAAVIAWHIEGTSRVLAEVLSEWLHLACCPGSLLKQCDVKCQSGPTELHSNPPKQTHDTNCRDIPMSHE